MIAGFAPIEGPDARVLVLGTVPSARSLAENRYYAHPRNSFWWVMESLLADGAELGHTEREALLVRSKVAVWDVLAAAERSGSLDAAIVSATAVPNDIAGFLRTHPGIGTVFFNGAAAERLFATHVAGKLGEGAEVRFVRLPSTSPANAAMSPADKLDAWRALAEALADGQARVKGRATIEIRALRASDEAWCAALLAEHFGSSRIVSRGRMHDANVLPGLVALRAGVPVGLLVYRIDGAECEVVALVTTQPRQGTGTALLATMRDVAADAGCVRLWLVTTNDNVVAQGFYDAVGWRLVATHAGAVARSRELKPEIPAQGLGGVPIEDELEYEFVVGRG